MKSILQFCFILMCNLMNAQNTFLKTYDLFTNSDDQCAWLDLEKNGINLLNNRLNKYTPTYRNFDLDGNPLAMKELNFNDYDYFSPTILKEDISYKILARSNKDSLEDNLYIYNFKPNGDSISTYLFKDKSGIYRRPIPVSFLKTPTHYIMTANSYSYVHPDTITTLASLWYLNHDFSVDTIISLIRNDYTYTYGAQLGPDENIYVYLYNNCTGQTPGCENPTRQRSIAVFRGKEFINEYFTEKYVNELYKGRISLITSDTNMIYGFEKRHNEVTKASIRCIDKNGNLKWESFDNLNGEDINYTYINELKNGDLLALGYISAEDFARAVYVKRIDKNGVKLWERIMAKDLPNVTYGAEGYVWRFKEDEHGNLYVVGQLGGATKDMLLMKVDSFGCVNQDKCNRLYVVDHKKDLYKYDQLDMKQKKWYYTVRKNDGSSFVEEVTIGEDTIMFDDKYGHRRYKDVWINNVEDTFKIRWDVSGKVGYMTRLNKNIWPDIQKDSILYDFTLKVGDRFQLPKGAGMARVIKTDSIDLLDGYKRKRLTLIFENLEYQNKYGNLIWVEGIGSPGGLFYFYDWVNDTRTTLNCYYDRDMKRWGEAISCNTTFNPKPPLKFIDLNRRYNVVITGFHPPYSERLKFGTDSILIGNTNYIPLLSSTSETSDDYNPTGYYFREVAGKVYKYDNFSIGESLIYDFNAKLGDSLLLNNELLLVTKIDSVAYNDGISRKRIRIRCQENQPTEYDMIEGIGSTYLRFSNLCGVDGFGYNVACIWQGEDLLFKNSASWLEDKCWLTGNNDHEWDNVKILPNPFKDVLSLTNAAPAYLRITDMTGKVMVEKNTSEEHIILDTSSWNTGMFFVSVQAKDGRTKTYKVVKY